MKASIRCSLAVALVVLLSTAGAAAGPADEVLRMLRRGVGERAILRTVYRERDRLVLRPEDVDRLIRAGASDPLINAIDGGRPFYELDRDEGVLRILNRTDRFLYFDVERSHRSISLHNRPHPSLPLAVMPHSVATWALPDRTFRLRYREGSHPTVEVKIRDQRTTTLVLEPDGYDRNDLRVAVRCYGRTEDTRVIARNALGDCRDSSRVTVSSYHSFGHRSRTTVVHPPVPGHPPVVILDSRRGGRRGHGCRSGRTTVVRPPVPGHPPVIILDRNRGHRLPRHGLDLWRGGSRRGRSIHRFPRLPRQRSGFSLSFGKVWR